MICCEYCGCEVEAERKTKKFCSSVCAQRKARGWPKQRDCRHCGMGFEVRDRSDANRQHCSRACAKNHNAHRVSTWQAEHPDAWRRYAETRKAKNPHLWREKWQKERLEIIDLLGGGCAVCGVSNPAWLHVDFIPTQRGEKFRHPRHAAFVRRNSSLFRLLCANHHYEITLTGRIEGSDIIQ